MLNDRVIRIAFAISFVGHCLFLGIPGFNINPSRPKQPKDLMIKMEIEKPPLLPKIDVMGGEKRLKEVIEKPKPPRSEPKLEPQLEEVVIEEPLKELIKEMVEVVDPAQEAMLRYQDMVKQKIEKVRRYPSWAKRQGIEGDVYLSFIVLSNGLSKDTKIIHFSGSKILDEEAVATIKRANPFPPLPKEIAQDFVFMEVTIVFTLK